MLPNIGAISQSQSNIRQNCHKLAKNPVVRQKRPPGDVAARICKTRAMGRGVARPKPARWRQSEEARWGVASQRKRRSWKRYSGDNRRKQRSKNSTTRRTAAENETRQERYDEERHVENETSEPAQRETLQRQRRHGWKLRSGDDRRRALQHESASANQRNAAPAPQTQRPPRCKAESESISDPTFTHR